MTFTVSSKNYLSTEAQKQTKSFTLTFVNFSFTSSGSLGVLRNDCFEKILKFIEIQLRWSTCIFTKKQSSSQLLSSEYYNFFGKN